MRSLVAVGILLLAASNALAQQPIPAPIQVKLQAKAGPQYPLRVALLIGRDSARLVFDDSTLTGQSMNGGGWMFGPPVTVAEADSCPPEKVLGRRLARILWRELGRPMSLERVTVRVQGTVGKDRWSYVDMYYYKSELERPWVGDPDQ